MKEITDEYLLSLVQKEEYVVMGCKFLICGLNTKNGLLVSSDPFYVGSGNFDKAKEYMLTIIEKTKQEETT